MRLVYALILALLSLPATPAAQTFGGGLDIGGAYRKSADGTNNTFAFSIGVPLSVRAPVAPAVSVYALARPDLAVGRRRDGLFEYETVTGGQRICRNTQNGQFAESSNCVGYLGGVSAEVGAAVQRLRVAAGYRVGVAPQPFGAVSVILVPGVFVRTEAGPRGGVVSIGIGRI